MGIEGRLGRGENSHLGTGAATLWSDSGTTRTSKNHERIRAELDGAGWGGKLS